MGGRKKFECDWMLAIEKKASNYLQTKWNCQIAKLAEGSWTVDWCIYKDGKAVSFAEFRRRFNNHDTYRTYNVSGAKIMKLSDLARQFRFDNSLMVIQFNDGLFYIPICQNFDGGRLVDFGRSNKRDMFDSDPSFEFSVNQLKRVALGCVTDNLTDKPRGFDDACLAASIEDHVYG